MNPYEGVVKKTDGSPGIVVYTQVKCFVGETLSCHLGVVLVSTGSLKVEKLSVAGTT